MEVVTINVGLISWSLFWLVYWTAGGILTWRAHVDKVREITHLKEVIAVLLINMLWSFFSIVLLCLLPLRVGDYHVILKCIFTYLLADIWFYHIHVFAHHPQIYQWVHKMHHKFTKPYALTALYCTGYETVVVNCFSVGLGPIIFQLPPPYIYIWFVLVSLNTVASHSGYTFSIFIDKSHEIHHAEFNYNYSFNYWLDKLYGTYRHMGEAQEESVLVSEKKNVVSPFEEKME